MTAQPFDQKIYMAASAEEVTAVLRFLQAYDDQPQAKYGLATSEESGAAALPETIVRALRLVVEAMAAGGGVTITPLNRQLTTHQAAEFPTSAARRCPN